MGNMRAPRMRRKRRREDELEEEELQQQKQDVATEVPQADRVLDLQKTAGNRAVGAALGRWSLPWFPQTQPQLAKWPKEAQAVFDGKLVVPIQSVGEMGSRGLGGKSGQATDADPEGPGEIVIVAVIGDHVVELHQAAAKGKHFEKVEIIIPGPNGTGMRYELENVYIASYTTSGISQQGGGAQSYQLSFSKRKASRTPPPARR